MLRTSYYSHFSTTKVVSLLYLVNVTITISDSQRPPTPGPPGCAAPP